MLSDMQLLGMASLINQDFGSILNKCQREEVEAYPWSYLFTNIVINSVPSANFVSGNFGTITLTQGSALVTFASPVSITGLVFPGWFLWVGATLTTPVLVQSVNTANSLTLSAPWGQASIVNGTSYSFQPLYYSVYPLQTIERVRQIDNLIETSQAELNSIDPSRIATGGMPSIRWANAPVTAVLSAVTQGNANRGDTQVELWPRPTGYLPYIVDGKLGAIDMVNAGDLPQIPSQVLEAKAMMYACRAVYASSGNPKWLSLSEAYKADYTIELEKVKQEDTKRVTPKGITSWGGRRLFDASVDYNHDLAGPPDFQSG
jgi:hypothetical protein